MTAIEKLLEDRDLLLLQSKRIEGKNVWAIDTQGNSAYDNSYMLVMELNISDSLENMRYAYFEDLDDLFYFYDLVK